MRILMISGVPGKAEAGAAGIVYNLTKELRELGHTVKPMFFEDLLPKQNWPNRFRAVEFAKRIASYVSEMRSDYDVVNIHAPFGFWYGALKWLRDPKIWPPYIMTMHGLEERRNYAMGREAVKGRADYFRWKNRIWQRLYHMPMYRWSFLNADQCIVTNRESLIFLQLRYNVPPDHVWFVPNGVGENFFYERSSPEGLGARLLFVGTWIDHKGIYYLADALKRVLSVVPGAKMTIAGCMEPEERVRKFFDASVQSALQVLPFVARTDMPALYAKHDIFVLPSLVEGMPLVLLEAMASGMAVITTESNGMTDLIEDTHDGLFVIPGDADSLSLAIGRLCNDARLQRRLGAAAQEKMKRYTWKQMARRHETIFNRAIGVKPILATTDPVATIPKPKPFASGDT
jgi:glycosyltransferase involved in cell wall biosynthesis